MTNPHLVVLDRIDNYTRDRRMLAIFSFSFFLFANIQIGVLLLVLVLILVFGHPVPGFMDEERGSC